MDEALSLMSRIEHLESEITRLRDMLNVDMVSPLNASRSYGVGTSVSIEGIRKRKARITGKVQISSNFYAYTWIAVHQEQTIEVGAPAYIDDPVNGRGTSDEGLLAFERSSHNMVPTDGSYIAELSPDPMWLQYEFDFTGESAHWIKITGSPLGSSYPWIDVPNANFQYNYQIGTTTQNPAVEKNGNTNVPNGKIVEAWRGTCSGYPYLFITESQSGNGLVPEIQKIEIDNATNGTFILILYSSDGSQVGTTAPIAYNASGAAIQTAINAVTSTFAVPYTVTVSQAGTTYTITFSGTSAYPIIGSNYSTLLSDQQWWFVYESSVPCNEPPVSLNTVCDFICLNGYNLKYMQTVFFSCSGVMKGDCVFTSVEGCCNCDQPCTCCTGPLPCPWWLCLWWPGGYCTGGSGGNILPVVPFDAPSVTGTSIPLQFVTPCEWVGDAGTITFSLVNGVYTLVFSAGNQFGCATYTNNAPWDCTLPYTVYFQSSSNGTGCNNCGNWPPSLTLTPSFSLPTDPNPCQSGSGSGSGSGGSGSQPCCSGDCPTPNLWDITFSLTKCPVSGGGGQQGWCANCYAEPTPIGVSFTGSGFSGPLSCFNGSWTAPINFLGDNVKTCSFASSTDPVTGCWFSGAIMPFGWEIEVLTAGGVDYAAYWPSDNPWHGDCCSPVTLLLRPNGESQPGIAPPTLTITPDCGDSNGSTTNVDCACNVIKTDLGCCWEGIVTGIHKPNTGDLIFCLLTDPSTGNYYWQLTVLINGVVAAIYQKVIGKTQPCCCIPVVLDLVYTTCAGASLTATAVPDVQCQSGSGSGSGSGVWWCVEVYPIQNSECYIAGNIQCISQDELHGDVTLGGNVGWNIGSTGCEGHIVAGPYHENTCNGGCQSGSGSGSGGSGSSGPNLCCSIFATVIYLDIGISNFLGGFHTNIPLDYDGFKYFLGAWDAPCGQTLLFRAWNNLVNAYCELDYSCDGGATWSSFGAPLGSSKCSPFEMDYVGTLAASGCGGCDNYTVSAAIWLCPTGPC